MNEWTSSLVELPKETGRYWCYIECMTETGKAITSGTALITQAVRRFQLNKLITLSRIG